MTQPKRSRAAMTVASVLAGCDRPGGSLHWFDAATAEAGVA